MKPLRWIGDSLQAVREFSDEARRETGFELNEIQKGREPSDWKSMPSIGLGVKEVRIRAENQYRVIYVAKFAEAVYILHAFAKKTQQTAKRDIDLATQRYRELVNQRKSS
ncbi:MAG: type II toxin-antitoxin system RelE/ParE family toxin [Gammaproteobacteria bacterium]|nr:type II toxin-antitoxin system RelE/ParE family toxin [Gammaproteobacteria bacterium]